MGKPAAIAAFCLLALVACRRATTPDVVARFGDFEITAAEVDARILALPPADRPQPGQDLDAWYEEQIRGAVVDRRLREEAEAGGLANDEGFLAAEAEAGEQESLKLCLADLRPEIEGVSQAEVRAAYDARAEDFALPERRAVYQLFIRRTPDRSAAEARREIEALRERVLRGESFQRLAAANSDSESRHRQGSIGWITPGQLPAGFEKVIFSLDEGVPSEPVATRDGFHLFYVDQILAPRRITFAEARKALRARLVADRWDAALAKLEAGIEPPPGTLTLDREEFSAVVKAGDPNAVVLRVGKTEVTLADLRSELRRSLGHRPKANRRPPSVDLAWQLLETLRRRELVLQHCQDTGQVPQDKLDAHLAEWRRKALLDAERRRRLIEVAERDEAGLRLYYEGNHGHFDEPPAWHLRRLRIPLGDDGDATMARLEKAAAQGHGDLDALQAGLGGKIDDLGFRTLAELKNLEPKLPPLVAPLGAGELSAPFRADDALVIVQSVARREAKPRPFAEVRDRVASAYVQQYTRKVYRELSDEILAGAELHILPEGLARLRAGGLPQPDVSVDQLEDLFEEVGSP